MKILDLSSLDPYEISEAEDILRKIAEYPYIGDTIRSEFYSKSANIQKLVLRSDTITTELLSSLTDENKDVNMDPDLFKDPEISDKFDKLCTGDCQDKRKSALDLAENAKKVLLETLEKDEKDLPEILTVGTEIFTELSTLVSDYHETMADPKKQKDRIHNHMKELKDKNYISGEKFKEMELELENTDDFESLKELTDKNKEEWTKEIDEKIKRTKSYKEKAKHQFNKVKYGIKGMHTSEKLSKAANGLESVLSGIEKFQKFDSSASTGENVLNVASGVLDFASAVAEFIPPPASIVTGVLSNVVSFFSGGTPSTEDVIKQEAEKTREFIADVVDQQTVILVDTIEAQGNMTRNAIKDLGIVIAEDFSDMNLKLNEVEEALKNVGTNLSGKLRAHMMELQLLLTESALDDSKTELKEISSLSGGMIKELKKQISFMNVNQEELSAEQAQLINEEVHLFDGDIANIQIIQTHFEGKCLDKNQLGKADHNSPLKKMCLILFKNYIELETIHLLVISKKINLLSKYDTFDVLSKGYIKVKEELLKDFQNWFRKNILTNHKDSLCTIMGKTATAISGANEIITDIKNKIELMDANLYRQMDIVTTVCPKRK